MSTDFSRARQIMVDRQLRTTDITNPDLLAAFLDVPREDFVPAELRQLAYLDEELPLGGGRFLAAPSPLAKLIQAASVGKDDIVLDIGCATGYSTAILSRLCSSVVALECDPVLAATASERLSAMGYDNAVVVEGPLEAGYPGEGPYDVILAVGSAETMPEAIAAQLKVGGRLVSVQGRGSSALASIWVNDDGVVSSRGLFNCALPVLPGFERKPEFTF